jgi:hypothetical protein
MKLNMTTARIGLAACLMFGWLAVSAFAQGSAGGPNQSESMIPRLSDVLGKGKAFSAKAHMTMTDGTGKEVFVTDSNYAYLDGNVRSESDLSNISPRGSSPAQAAAQKQTGRYFAFVLITIPDRHLIYTLMPAVKAYFEGPFPQTPDQTGTEPPKVERTEIGTETIDGHPCAKCKMVVTWANGSSGTMMVWEATDLDHYPVQTQVGTGTARVITTTFHDIDRTKPDPSLFEVPAGYTRYNNMQEIMTNRVGNTPSEIERNLGIPPPGRSQ